MSDNEKIVGIVSTGNVFRLGVLICDHVNEVLQPEFDDYPTMFNQLFELISSKYDFELVYFNVVDNEFPKNIHDCDGYMTSGSKSGANDEVDWIKKLEEFIIELYKANKRFVGICFGHQLLAKALGGSVAKSKKGWGVGVHTSHHTSHINLKVVDKTLTHNKLNLVVSHQDQIQELPKNTKVLYSSEFCPFSMIQVGENFIGMQGHPEFSRAYSSALMEMRKEIIPANLIKIGKESLNNKTDSKAVAQWIVEFLMKDVKAKI